ncbi:MAG: zf-TFIIB domain-containing protein [Candidatus Eremiobacteraeota bacterium]|nr:zf-TFIIB domain-containing protein [Candidatus Eremiobacteraeota bacterium]
MQEVEATRGELESLLTEMRAAGEWDSSGQFTVDADKALAKMRRFQVERPQDFALWLAAAAVLGGATELSATIGVDQLCLEFDGAHFQAGELEQVLDEGGSLHPGRIGHLAFALTAALATEPHELIVESFDQRLQIRPGTTRLSRSKGEPARRLRFLLVREQSQASAWEDLELNYLRERIPAQLLKIKVNRKTGAGFLLPTDLLHELRFVEGKAAAPLLERLAPAGVFRRPGLGLSSALIRLDSWQRQGQSEVHFLVDGVLFRKVLQTPVCFRAIVSSPDLSLDLSRSGLVESPELRAVLSGLEEIALDLADEFVRGYASVKPGLRHLGKPWLEGLVGHWRLGERCRQLLDSYHTHGMWLEYDDPGKLVQDLLGRYPRSLPQALPAAAPSGFWGALASLFKAAPDPLKMALEAPSDGSLARKKWLAALLAPFDPESTVRLGLSAAVKVPDWLVLEGITPEGSRLLLRAQGKTVTIGCRDPRGQAWRGELKAPGDWVAEWEREEWHFSGGDWHAPRSLIVLLNSVLDARRAVQGMEILDCPGCGRAMEKVVADVVLDRCRPCHSLWLDYAELEWLVRTHPSWTAEPPEGEGSCPRCRLPLRPGTRASRLGSECPECRGVWLRGSFKA